MTKMLIGASALLLAGAITLPARQTPPAQRQTITMAAGLLRGYHGMQRNLLEAAEKMPEADYAFKPTAEIRPFGQLVAHVALSQFGGCAVLKGEANPKKAEKEEQTRTKAEHIALLKASTAYCDSVFDAMTDQALVELVKSGPNEVAKGLMLAGTNGHANEMYGTMAVYLRLKGIVPPTTERQNQQKKSQ
jgi:hypothetical protein